MFSNIIRFILKFIVGFTVAVVVLSVILMIVIHMPDRENIDIFAGKRDAFEAVNSDLRQELADRDRTKMRFDANFDYDAVVFNKETIYAGPAVGELGSFGVLVFEDITVRTDMTIFSYGGGLQAIVYTENGNPGSFGERFVGPMTRSYKLADNWYYTQFCDLDD